MRVIVVKDSAEMGKRAAQLVADEMKRKEFFVMGLATGSTPLPLYNSLIDLHKTEGLDFSTTVTFNLDEYIGLSPEHDQSYRHFMDENFFNHININKKNTHVPNGLAEDIEAECEHYEQMIDDVGGIDIQIVGIGGNGHVGFNEPGSSLGSLTRIKTLTDATVKDNARFFDRIEDVPRLAITMGIGSIQRANKVILLADGTNKAQAIEDALEGPVTTACPASALQLHRFCTAVITEDCAIRLTLQHE